jgi:hypothetical protein
MDKKLQEIREWAEQKIAQGSEPPWAWYQYMKLVETIRALEAGMDATVNRTENSPQSVERSGVHLRLVGPTDQPDIAQPHHAGLPVQMPM